jgi:hypothetical protein
MARRLLLLALAAPCLQGCVQTALSVATLPVKVAGRAVDLATTSQAEADQKRGRQLRQREERLGKLQRDYDSLTRKCTHGDQEACQRQQRVYAEIQLILPTIPAEPGARPTPASADR